MIGGFYRQLSTKSFLTKKSDGYKKVNTLIISNPTQTLIYASQTNFVTLKLISNSPRLKLAGQEMTLSFSISKKPINKLSLRNPKIIFSLSKREGIFGTLGGHSGVVHMFDFEFW